MTAATGPAAGSYFGPCICEGAGQCPGCNEAEAKKFWDEIAAADARYAVPPCLECSATSPEDALEKCLCCGDKDYCHGGSLWPDDETDGATP